MIVMAVDCGKINIGLVQDTCTPTTPGTAGRLVLLNKSDIKTAGKDGANFWDIAAGEEPIVEEIILNEGAKAYDISAYENTVVGSAEINAGTYINNFTHSVVGRIFVKSECAKTLINQLLNAKVVALVENLGYASCSDNEAEPKWEGYGFQAGLKFSELTASTEMSDGIVYEFTLATADGASEGFLPVTIWGGSIEATDALIESLL